MATTTETSSIKPPGPAAPHLQLEDVALRRSRHREQPRRDLPGQPEAAVEDARRRRPRRRDPRHSRARNGRPEDLGLADFLIPEQLVQIRDNTPPTPNTSTRMMAMMTARRRGPGLSRKIRPLLAGLAVLPGCSVAGAAPFSAEMATSLPVGQTSARVRSADVRSGPARSGPARGWHTLAEGS